MGLLRRRRRGLWLGRGSWWRWFRWRLDNRGRFRRRRFHYRGRLRWRWNHWRWFRWRFDNSCRFRRRFDDRNGLLYRRLRGFYMFGNRYGRRLWDLRRDRCLSCPDIFHRRHAGFRTLRDGGQRRDGWVRAFVGANGGRTGGRDRLLHCRRCLDCDWSGLGDYRARGLHDSRRPHRRGSRLGDLLAGLEDSGTGRLRDGRRLSWRGPRLCNSRARRLCNGR
jgi:hypothetical protein